MAGKAMRADAHESKENNVRHVAVVYADGANWLCSS